MAEKLLQALITARLSKYNLSGQTAALPQRDGGAGVGHVGALGQRRHDLGQIDAATTLRALLDGSVIRETIKELTQRLPNQFAQVHRSTIVNLHHVHKVQPHNNDYQLTLSNGQSVAASRRFKADWSEQLLPGRSSG